MTDDLIKQSRTVDASFAGDKPQWHCSRQVAPGAQVHAKWRETLAEIYRDGGRAGRPPFIRQLPFLKRMRRESSFTNQLHPANPTLTGAGSALAAAFLSSRRSIPHSSKQALQEVVSLELQAWASRPAELGSNLSFLYLQLGHLVQVTSPL